MTVTRLKRKHRKNIARANNKQHIIKELLRTPVLKNVELEELKSRFAPTGVADAVAHSDVVEKAKEVVADAGESVKEAVSGTDEKADNAEAFDAADAVTKP